MTPQEILRGAAAIIEQPGRWTQAEYAKNAQGYRVPPLSEQAVCFCAIGAMAWVMQEEDVATVERSEAAVALRIAVGGGVATFNDTTGRTAGDVAVAMRSAAARLDQ